MNQIDVKQRIGSLHQLPVLPHLAREILSSLDAGTVHWEEVSAIAEFDDALVHRFKAAASRECPPSPDASLDVHLMALGISRVAQLTFEHIAPSMFDGLRSPGLDLKAFWAHAFAVGRYAERLAQKINSRFHHLAFVSGVLHDIGKPALDRVVPGGYTRALELVRQQGLYALEAERRELGADHTVAGKWLAEAWGVPSSIVSTIWLHHHPPGTLDATPYPVELIEIVSLANFLAHGDKLETPPQERLASLDEQRYLRLGLERLDVLELLRESTDESARFVPAESTPAGSGVPVTSRLEITRLRYERNFYETLCTLHERMQPGVAPTTQLTLFVDGLRKAFSIPVGLCYLTDESSETDVVLRWRSPDEEPECIPLTVDGAGTEASTSLDSLVATLVSPGDDAGIHRVVHRHGFVALPLLNGNRSVGQLIFQSGNGGPILSDTFLQDLMRFVKSAGVVLARCNAVRGVHEEAESLAAAVWKQELTHRHDRRTERLISVGKMAAGAAHEINNPLAVISGKAQLLLANAQRPEDKRALEIVVEHSQRASGILRDLLQFARPNPPQLLASRISYIVKNSVDRVRQKFADEGIQLVEDYAQDLPQISVDRIQLDQVFQNLLKNAVQAMARQGDKLTVRVRPNQDRTAVLVQIIDTGQGIAADIMDKVFEPFFTTQSGAEGTGMGLAVCHGIVEAHRGTITLHSQEGMGTTCTVTLPLTADKRLPVETPTKSMSSESVAATSAVPDQTSQRDVEVELAPELAAALQASALRATLLRSDRAARVPAPPEAHTPPQPVAAPEDQAGATSPSTATPRAERGPSEGENRLLLIDDDEALRDVLAEALRNRGYLVRTASDGLEALAEVIANPVDLVLLDGAIQGVNTPLALAEEIRKRSPNASIVLLVGPTSPLDTSQSSESGVHAILRKPFNVSQLFEVISKSLAKRDVA